MAASAKEVAGLPRTQGEEDRRRLLIRRSALVAIAVVSVGLVTFQALMPGLPDQTWLRVLSDLDGMATAQGFFRREDYYEEGRLVYANPVDGEGFQDLYQIGGPGSGGLVLGLIPVEVASATDPDHALAGHYFVDILGDADGPYDFEEWFGFCAVPTDPDRPTVIIDAFGTRYEKITGGKPIRWWPDVEKEGWVFSGGEAEGTTGEEAPDRGYSGEANRMDVGAGQGD